MKGNLPEQENYHVSTDDYLVVLLCELFYRQTTLGLDQAQHSYVIYKFFFALMDKFIIPLK